MHINVKSSKNNVKSVLLVDILGRPVCIVVFHETCACVKKERLYENDSCIEF